MQSAMCGHASPSSIIYHNEARDITLIDIPKSIAEAQGRSDVLLSTAPLETPIPLYEEPKTGKAKAKANKIPRHLASSALQAEYKCLVEQSLAEIRHHVSGAWCAPRKVMPQIPKPGDMDMQIDDAEKELEGRMREWAALVESKGDETTFDFQKMMASLGATPEPNATVTETVSHKWCMSYRPARDIQGDAQRAGSVPQTEPLAAQEPWTSTFHNPDTHALALVVFENQTQSDGEVPTYRFTVPPRATFFLSDSTHPDAFRASFRELTDEYTLPRHFDLVLLDPPWPNRSVKRKGGYDQVGGMPHIKKMLLRMDIEHYLEHDALMGIWITNKEAMRTHVLGPGGLFEKWNIGLIEEWIWVKTTTQGEPMFDIDSAMRKPYEILLLGRAAPNSWTTMAAAPRVRRRVIVAVPDVHSRKPCLKALFEPYMRDVNDYSALEVFSRHLVAGWTSWGNEALKYNWDRYWTSTSESQS